MGLTDLTLALVVTVLVIVTHTIPVAIQRVDMTIDPFGLAGILASHRIGRRGCNYAHNRCEGKSKTTQKQDF
jgi:hypothetical protein